MPNNKHSKKKVAGTCDTCTYFTYDEESESWGCDVDMDEDDYMRLMTDHSFSCPYYSNGDEYLVVRHQM